MCFKGILRLLPILAIFLIAQIRSSDQFVQWRPNEQQPNSTSGQLNPTVALEGIVNTVAVGQPGENGVLNTGPFGQTRVGIYASSAGRMFPISYTYSDRRRNFRQKRAIPRSRAQVNQQVRRRGTRPRRQQKRNRQRKAKRTQSVEREIEGPPPRRRQNNRRPARRNNNNRYYRPGPNSAWNQNPRWRAPATRPPPVTPFFDLFSDLFLPTTVQPFVYTPVTPSSVDYTKKHGVCYCYDTAVGCPSDLSPVYGAEDCEEGKLACCEDS